MTDLLTSLLPLSPLFGAAERVQHRIESRLIEGFSQWWQMPLLVLALVGVAGIVLWMYRRDAAELPRGMGVLLAALRLGALAALAAAYLDFERTSEHEIVFPSRVALLIDSSASMTLEDDPAIQNASTSRAAQALEVLDGGGLLTALAPTHEVAVWRFDADAESLTVLPATTGIRSPAGEGGPEATAKPASAEPAAVPPAWREKLAPRGFETRLGETLGHVLDQEPTGALAGVILLSDGANNAGIDPAAAATALAKANVPIFSLGIGSDHLPANVRVADLLVPARVYPGDRFSVAAYLQAQGLAGQTVKVELSEAPADSAATEAAAPAGSPRPGRLIDSTEVVLGGNGELTAVRFEVPGLTATGRRQLALRVLAPAADRLPADNLQAAEVEVVDRVTQVLLLAGGPTREYQFMRNVLDRDKSFAVDVLLGTAGPGVSQDARRVLEAFPATAEELATYDSIVAFDYDWRRLDPAAQSRLERWVSRESGGLVLVAGSICMDAWLADPQTALMRNLYPVELRRANQVLMDEPAGFEEPMPLQFTREGQEAEFLWLGASRIASQTVWSGFKGVFSCFDTSVAKPGATVYARVSPPGAPSAQVGTDSGLIYMASQFYGSGSVFFLGSGETWRLRSLDDSLFERLSTQLLRHVSQGRLLGGARRTRLLVERDRFAVGSNVVVRVVGPDTDASAAAAGAPQPICMAVGPDGTVVRVPLAGEPGRTGVLQGSFVAAREGGWRIDVDLGGGSGDTLSRRVQAKLPDRELERPRLDRGLLERLATLTGGATHFLEEQPFGVEAAQALAARIPDRSRKEYETGAPDGAFKRRLNAWLMGLSVGLLCLEWIVRRLVKLA